MNSKTYDDKILETFVNSCIDNIIMHELIEGVTDLKSFADFALQLDLDDYRLIEGIGQGTSMTFEELSDEEKKKIEYFSSTSLYDKEYPMGGVTRRAYEYEKWFAHLLTIVNERVKQYLKDFQERVK